MLFSKNLCEYIHQQFMDNKETPGLRGGEIYAGLEKCSEDERAILEFYYATMASADIGDYDFSLYKKYADFGISLLENPMWDVKIPEDIFLNYVLYYRVNNEGIEDSREFFYNALKDRIAGKNMKEAALLVNKWCAEHVTYQPTDERTMPPLGVVKSSFGRCGEESTLLVTAMRSVGIPARQVYTPRWAHCDDNHAWVEVWCDGSWYFLGACEPEPVLNLGWFNNASSRAMLVDSKSFLPVEGEEAITKDGQSIILNEIKRYAPSRYFTVTVKDGEPLSGVTVYFELLNGSEFSPLASIVTDDKGRAGLTLGFGSVHIHAVSGGYFAGAFVDTGETDSFVLDFSGAVKAEPERVEDFNFRAPDDKPQNYVELTEEQKDIRRSELKYADERRKEYRDRFFDSERAEELASKFENPGEVMDVLKGAEGNFEEVYNFLSMDFGEGNRELQLKMLTSLVKKDLRDVKSSVLSEHFFHAIKFKDDYPSEIFISYILCPRAHYEQLSSFRTQLSSLFDGDTVQNFRREPKLVWDYVSQLKPVPPRENERLMGTPSGMVKSGKAGTLGRKVLFTAICRTLGIPARINPVDLSAQYMEGGVFKNVEDEAPEAPGTAGLILSGCETNEKWTYLHNWTLGILKDGAYQTLDLANYQWNDGKLELSLNPGFYRLITSSRMPNGNQFARKYCFSLAYGETRELEISLRQTEIKDMLVDITFTPFKVLDNKGEYITLDSLTGDKPALYVWLEEGREPTEHILNELIEAKDAVNSLDFEKIFIIRSRDAYANRTFAKALEAIPSAKVYCSDFNETAAVLARRMYVDPEGLPLTIIARGNHGIYACSGYNVGIADLLIKITKLGCLPPL